MRCWRDRVFGCGRGILPCDVRGRSPERGVEGWNGPPERRYLPIVVSLSPRHGCRMSHLPRSAMLLPQYCKGPFFLDSAPPGFVLLIFCADCGTETGVHACKFARRGCVTGKRALHWLQTNASQFRLAITLFPCESTERVSAVIWCCDVTCLRSFPASSKDWGHLVHLDRYVQS